MKKIYLIGLLIVLGFVAQAQNFGLSFTYFFPKNGDFSVPVTPFSIRGVGFDITSFASVETGGSFYRMSGMNVRDIPFESDKALVGPFFTLFVPLELVLSANLGKAVFKVKGGGFGFYNLGTKLNEGNLDRALRQDLGWLVLNSDFDFDNKPGFGYLFGGEIIYYLNKKLGINLEVQYLNGSSDLNLRGTYSGVPDESTGYTTANAAYPNSKLDFSGFEVSVGAIITP